jgi:excisionase family DNA binding protein
MSEKLITVREASDLLGVMEKEIIEMARIGNIPCYRVGGEFIRFRKSEVLAVRSAVHRSLNIADEPVPFTERMFNFFYFNDFYIVSGLLMAILAGAIILS